MSLSTTSNQQLTYKELQQAIKSYKEQGLTGIKLNSKHCVLQEEYERITNATVKDEAPATVNQTQLTQQPVTNSATASNYPFCENTVKVENKPGVTAVKPTVERSETTVNERSTASDHQLFTTRIIPAMSNKYAPSWLCKPYVVYVIDGVDYLPHELEVQLQGQVCQLPAVVNEEKLAANLPPRLQQPARKDRVSNARQPQPIINVSKELPKAKLTFKSQEDYNPYFIDTAKAARYSKTLGDVEKQAARNLEDGIKYASSATKQGFRNVISFAKGFHARQVERASKVA